jgi:hypothetical protein
MSKFIIFVNFFGHLCHFHKKAGVVPLSVQFWEEHFLCGPQPNIFFPSLFDGKPNNGKENILPTFSPSPFFPSSFS